MNNSVTLTHMALILFVLLVSIACIQPARAACATYATHSGVTDGYYLDNACTAIINNYAPCKVVTNSTGAQLFVPSYYPAASNTIGQNEWNSFLAHPPAGVSVASCSCTLPWGGSLTPGQSVTAYQSNPVACHGSCTSQTRTCTCTSNSSLCVLSGSYTKQSCSVTACLPCSLPWGGSINDGQSATAYSAATMACGSSCTGQTRSCNNGSLSGSYTHQSCSVNPCPCSLPWGGSISSGSSVTAYNTSASCGGCSGQTRSCSNGFLSGSYTNGSCNNSSCASCSLPWGGSIAHGAHVTAYAASSVPYGSSCTSQTRTCNNGSLSGSYTHQSCTVQSPPSTCVITYDGSAHTVANGFTVTRYRNATGHASDPCQCGGSMEGRISCGPQTATCSNGVVTGTNPVTGAYTSCTVSCTNLCNRCACP